MRDRVAVGRGGELDVCALLGSSVTAVVAPSLLTPSHAASSVSGPCSMLAHAAATSATEIVSSPRSAPRTPAAGAARAAAAARRAESGGGKVMRIEICLVQMINPGSSLHVFPA